MLGAFGVNRELEVRIGRRNAEGSLVLSPETLQFLDDTLRGSKWLESSRWSETYAYFYRVGGRALRTEVSFDSADMRMNRCTVEKQRVDMHDENGPGTLAMRACLSDEVPIPSPPDAVLPYNVRIKQRASHTYRGETCTVRYDLTRSWSASSRTEVEARQKVVPAQCELELELVAIHDADADRVVASLHAKVVDTMRLIEER